MTCNPDKHPGTSILKQESAHSLNDKNKYIAETDPWSRLRVLTQARIGLGRVGTSLPTCEILNFGCAHAMARDTVHLPLDVIAIKNQLSSIPLSTIHVQSQAVDRNEYLVRPDKGRQLNSTSVALLADHAAKSKVNVLFVIGDGLSSLAVSAHAVKLIEAVLDIAPSNWLTNPIVIATQARVAISDQIGQLMEASVVIMLIGERPGLSSPDSLGAYLTYKPAIGRTDADRNCISNIRSGGLSYADAARKLTWLIEQSLQREVSGVALKDESDYQPLMRSSNPNNTFPHIK